jgi:hypothetical protein
MYTDHQVPAEKNEQGKKYDGPEGNPESGAQCIEILGQYFAADSPKTPPDQGNKRVFYIVH